MKQILKLSRISMSSAIAFSAVAGYVFNTGEITWVTIAVFSGVLFLACAATALNQIQERRQDALMSRTMNRPIPSGQMTVNMAAFLTLAMGITGTVILYIYTTPLTAALGLFNIVWYNAIYTPLKRRTGFVVIVGAVTGAIPPVMGWTAAGGSVFDSGILFVAAFFFLWQIPHFLLLLLRYKEDYRKAGFQSVTSTLSDNQIKFIIFIWILGSSLITLFFPLFRIISDKFLIGCIILLNLFLITFFYKSAFNTNMKLNLGRAFGSLYLYQLSILAILIFQALK